MNHCEPLSHQLRDARREVAAKNQLKGKCPEEKATEERDGRPCRRMTSKWENDRRSRQVCADRPACSRTKEKASTKFALHSTDLPSTPVRQKKNTRRSRRDVYSIFETVPCIKARTMIQLRVYTIKEIRWFPEKIYRLYCFRPVEDCLLGKISFAISVKHQVHVISYLLTISKVPFLGRISFLLHKSSTN